MTTVSFNQVHSRALRFWHWATFIVILLILFTVFTGKFYVNPWNTVPVVKHSLQKEGITLNDGQVFNAVKDLNTGVWKWHQRYGYVLAILFLFRILLEFFQPGEQRFFRRLKNAALLMKAKAGNKRPSHYLFVRIIYLLFYLLLATIVATGLTLSFFGNRMSNEDAHSFQELHGSCFYFLLLFVFIHVTGVLLAERKNYRNIISGMVHGGRENEINV